MSGIMVYPIAVVINLIFSLKSAKNNTLICNIFSWKKYFVLLTDGFLIGMEGPSTTKIIPALGERLKNPSDIEGHSSSVGNLIKISSHTN